MTTLDIARLREVAEDATPGPWEHGDGNEGMWPPRPLWMVTNHAFHNPPEDDDEPWLAMELHTGVEADATFVAAFDPPTVLALLDRLDAAEAALGKVRGALARLIDEHAPHGFAGVMRAPEDGCPTYVAAVALFDSLASTQREER